MEFAVSRRVLAYRWNVDVTRRVHGIASGSSVEEFRLIELEQIGVRGRRRRRRLETAAVKVIERQVSAAVITVVDVIGRVLLVAHPAEIVGRL